MQRLVGLYLEIEKYPFDRAGPLIALQEKGSVRFQVQGIAHHVTFDMAASTDQALGPFDSPITAARTLIKTYLDMIAKGEIGFDYQDDVLLAHLFRLGIISDIWTRSQPEKEKFYLKHPDDKGDHILVDDSFNIVGIIDWEWSQTVSKEEAFSSPCMMWPVGRFYDGYNELPDEEVRFAQIFRERGREDLANYVMHGRKVQRFLFALGPSSEEQGDWKTFMDLFAGLCRVQR